MRLALFFVVALFAISCRNSQSVTGDFTSDRGTEAATTSTPAISDESSAVVSLRTGVFTDAQAERGRGIFESTCRECHTPESFAAAGFMNMWAGQPVAKLFDQVSYTMPETNPGGLTNAQYADVLTYLFKLNGLPAGQREMPSEMEDLRSIRIERAGER